MGKRRHKLLIAAAIGIIAIATAFLSRSRPNPYQREMRPVYAVIAAGEQGWADEASKLLDGIIARSPKKQALAEKLLQESDASLVAEGMVLAVRSHHPQARSLVQQHLTDHRWNWYLANNDELAQQLLLKLDEKPVENWVASRLVRTNGS